MSGSGSTTFVVLKDKSAAETLAEKFRGKFGPSNWLAVVPV
jgi:4-diphosphocytidyl-2C-methyl-D-erythritol kinase